MADHYRRGDPEAGCGWLIVAAVVVFWALVAFVVYALFIA